MTASSSAKVDAYATDDKVCIKAGSKGRTVVVILTADEASAYYQKILDALTDARCFKLRRRRG